MTDEQIIIAVAKLDGWVFGSKSEASFADPTKEITSPCWLDEHNNPARKFKDYLESRDAIIPVIEKLLTGNSPEILQARINFMNSIRAQIAGLAPKNKVGTPMITDFMLIWATPKQLCIALLKATGKWEE